MSDIRKNAETIIIENWNTPEFQERLKKVLEETKNKEETKRKKIDKMFSNTDYINWLINFTMQNNGCFSDDDWLYNPEDITKKDSEKVNDLQLFFKGIDKYAREYNIDPIIFDQGYGVEYKIKVNDIGLQIGLNVGQGSYTLCKKININDDKVFINFFDINNNKNNNKTLTRKK